MVGSVGGEKGERSLSGEAAAPENDGLSTKGKEGGGCVGSVTAGLLFT